MSDCRECGRDIATVNTNGRAAYGYCNPCYKRLVWRPQNGAAVEREREYSRRWKQENRDQNLVRDREYRRRKRAAEKAA